jgi:2-polyprenyl-3-methyl-5-hydroxy-6-metoxy-1,4-benzoquinol methylase
MSSILNSTNNNQSSSRTRTLAFLIFLLIGCAMFISLNFEVTKLRREVTDLRRNVEHQEEHFQHQPTTTISSSSSSTSSSMITNNDDLSTTTTKFEQAMLKLLRTQAAKDAIMDLGKSPPPIETVPYELKGKKDDRGIDKGGLYGGLSTESAKVGGFTLNDTDGQSFLLWEFLIKVINIKSMMDIGCGRGISTKFMLDRGVKVLCVEGSNDAIKHSLLPKNLIVNHDYNRGPWFPDETFDFAWSVEFLEHVGRPYFDNYIVTFKQAALVFVTHSLWGGYHHVEVHSDFWWFRSRFEAHGFVYSEQLTTLFRDIVGRGQSDRYTGQHLSGTSEVFINPRVASKRRHRHLFGGPGCFDGEKTLPCEGLDLLPPEFRPVWVGRSINPQVEVPLMSVMTKENIERG